MRANQEERSHSMILRQRAEAAIQGKPVDMEDLTLEDLQYLLHEIQVHQTELSIQNEELRRTQVELEISRDQFSELYNFAPAGYCTVNRKGLIRNANQTLAGLLGVGLKELPQEKFSHFIAREDQDVFYLHCLRSFEKNRHQSSEIRLIKSDGKIIYVHLESIVSQTDPNYLMIMVIDISRQRHLQHQLIEQREKERYKIAQDLHDGPVQALASIIFKLQAILSDYPDSWLAEELKIVQENIREQIQVLREYSTNLRPNILVRLGLEKAIQSHAENFEQKYPQVRLQLQVHPTRSYLPDSAAVALFRIYQEAMANIAKHALPEATLVNVRLEKSDNQVQLIITDNGSGFDLPDQWLDLAQESRLGILGMRERAESVGGQFRLQTKPGGGTQVWVVIPIDKNAVR